MSEKSESLKTVILPQYQASPAFMERFLDAVHDERRPIERSQNTPGSIKLVDGREISADGLDYFLENKPAMENEFYDDLKNEIGTVKTNWFVEVVARDWYDGKGSRNGARVTDLKISVRNATQKILQRNESLQAVVHNHLLPNIETTLSDIDVASILVVNKRMMVRHIENWKDIRSDSSFVSNDDLFFRRGLALQAPLDVSIPYKEWDYINSYSIAFSAPEKFAQMSNGKTPAIINGDLSLFDGRILFFSPFIPGMCVGQLEAGIIPGDRAQPIKAQDSHGGILEYILGCQPE